jgi:hypothetical protein
LFELVGVLCRLRRGRELLFLGPFNGFAIFIELWLPVLIQL